MTITDPMAQVWRRVLGGLLGWALAGSAFVGTGVVIAYDAKGKRDPFVPLVHEGRWIGGGSAFGGGHPSDLMLAGILWDPAGQSLALINDLELKVGEMVAGYQVTEIRPDAVVVVREGKPVVLQISFEPHATSGESRSSAE